jgi:hypothetical protein
MGVLNCRHQLVGLVFDAGHTLLGHVGFEDPLAFVSPLFPHVLERDRPVRVVCKSYRTWALA